MTIKKYQVNEDTQFFKRGDVVYDFINYDYGLASDDTNAPESIMSLSRKNRMVDIRHTRFLFIT